MNKIKIDKYGVILFFTGFAALVYEILFIKTLSLFLGQSIYAFSVMLAAFMFGIGIGSIYSTKLKGEPLWQFSLTQFGIAAYSILFIPLLNKMNIPSFLISKFPFYLQNILLIIVSLAILIIPTSLMGLSFPLLLKHVMEEKNEKKKIGQLFAYNTFGGLLGSLAAGFIFLPMFGVSTTLIIAAIINLSVAVSIKTRHASKRLIAATLLLAILLSVNPEVDPHVMGSFYNSFFDESFESFMSDVELHRKKTEILYSDFDIYGHICVFKDGQYKLLYINGKPDGGTSSDLRTELMIGYIPMLLHESPQKVAVVGLGTGLTVGATLQFDAEKVDVYEINPGVVEVNKYFEEESHHALSNPKTKVIMGDARRNLNLSGESYDVIISEPSNPWIEGEGFLFTKEYYEIIDTHLNKNGIFVQWIGAYDYTVEAFNILLNTLHAKFPHIQIWSDGPDFYIVTSREPKRFDYIKTRNKINEPTIKADIEKIGYFEGKKTSPESIFFSHYITNYEKTVETKINTDDNSLIEFSTGRFSGRSINHVKRFVKGQQKNLPVNLKKSDLDIEIETDLSYYGSNFAIIQVGAENVIVKQIIFKDDTRRIYVQTTTKDVPPTLAEAKNMAGPFNVEVTKSEDYLFRLMGKDGHGIIGYCNNVKQTFLAYSTSKAPVNIGCK